MLFVPSWDYERRCSCAHFSIFGTLNYHALTWQSLGKICHFWVHLIYINIFCCLPFYIYVQYVCVSVPGFCSVLFCWIFGRYCLCNRTSLILCSYGLVCFFSVYTSLVCWNSPKTLDLMKTTPSFKSFKNHNINWSLENNRFNTAFSTYNFNINLLLKQEAGQKLDE